MDAKIDKRQRLTTTDTNKVIKSWFLEHYLDKPDKLRQNKTWQTIKYYVDKMGHYKAKKRGEPNPDINLAQKGVKMGNRKSMSTCDDTSYEVFND